MASKRITHLVLRGGTFCFRASVPRGLQPRFSRREVKLSLAAIVRQRFLHPTATLCELYGRMVFNVISGNTDGHARNHAAFWNGANLTLTPASGICPQMRLGGEASQAMAILGEDRRSSLALCIVAARNFLLDEREAVALIQCQLEIVHASWEESCDEAALEEVNRRLLRDRSARQPARSFPKAGEHSLAHHQRHEFACTSPA